MAVTKLPPAAIRGGNSLPRQWRVGLLQSRRMRLVMIAAIGALLFWEVLTRSLAAYYAEESPQTALTLQSNNVPALLNLAQAILQRDDRFKKLEPLLTPPSSIKRTSSSHTKAAEPGENAGSVLSEPKPDPAQSASGPNPRDEEARAQIELALSQDPLNARALRMLGQLTEYGPDAGRRTEGLMSAAARNSLMEGEAVYWMMRRSYHSRDYGSALRYADALLRGYPQILGSVAPMLGKIAEVPGASDQLKQLLATSPNWRSQFFRHFPDTITDARTPLDVLLSLRDAPVPPDPTELRPYLDFLIKHGFYDLAYFTWLQFLPKDELATTGNLFNGDFEATPTDAPFDWNLTSAFGASVQIASLPQPGEQALLLQFGPGRVDYKDVKQLLLLAPGPYRFTGKLKADLVSQRGLEWRVTCLGEQKAELGRSEAIRNSDPSWRTFEFSFIVPEHDCPAQTANLVFDARSASERFISGSIWFDDLKIASEPIANASE